MRRSIASAFAGRFGASSPRGDNEGVHARFYAPAAYAQGDVVALPADEAAHLTRVLRLTRGDRVIVFNGRGHAFEAIVQSTGKGGVDVVVGSAHEAAREARVAITLVQAILKGDKMDDVVRDAVMIGVAAIQPVITTRSEVTRASLERGRRRERWERIAVSSAKQCGRAVVPAILDPRPFDAVSALVDARQLPGPALMLVEPEAAADVPSLNDLDGPPPKEASLLLGPEGGWTADEIAVGSGRCRLLTLGGRTIRGDAMALVTIAALYAKWGEY